MQEDEAAAAAAAAGLGIGILVFYFLLYLVFCVPMMKIFAKAGKPGWAAFVPIYNMIVMLEISGKPVWWIVLFIVPIVSFVMWILSSIALAERFGKGAGFGVGIAFLWFVFLYILAFDDSEYSPPALA